MTRLRTFLPLPLVLAFEAAAVGVLHRLGEAPGLGASTLVTAHAAPEEAFMAAARLVALGVAWWLLATTLLCVAARATRLPSAVRAVEWAALPAVRRLAERSLAAALSLSVATVALPAVEVGPAMAAEAALPFPLVEDGVVVPPILTVRQPGTPDTAPGPGSTGQGSGQFTGRSPGGPGRPPLPPHGALAAAPLAAAPPAAPLAAPTPPAGLPAQRTVAEGEHLWGLAREVVAGATGRAPADVGAAEVAAYWVRLIEANPSSLRSGDPDLVYPGETLTLPAPGA